MRIFSRMSLAYSGCHNIYNFLSLSLADIDTLTKTVPAEEPTPGVTTRSATASQTTTSSPLWVPLLLGEKNILKAFKGYIWWYCLEHEGKLPMHMLIERSEFDDFRISPNWNPDILFARSLPTPQAPMKQPPT